MRTYGSKRSDKTHCRYGCCGAKLHKTAGSEKNVKPETKARRKSARVEGKKSTQELEGWDIKWIGVWPENKGSNDDC